MEMIEDMEESILSGRFAVKILNIINNQCINTLIEVKKIVDFAFALRSGKLAFEETRVNIQHS